MVFINTQHINSTAPEGTFGGAKCICKKCQEERKVLRKKKAEHILKIVQENIC